MLRGGENFAVRARGVRGGTVSLFIADVSRVSCGMEPGQTDERLDYLSAYIQKSLKLKPEKWTKMMAQVSFSVFFVKKLPGSPMLQK